MATALFTFTPGLPAQTSNSPDQSQQPGQQQAPPDQTQQQAPPDQSQQQESKTYAGKIMKLQDGRFALVTGQTAEGKLSGHFLDNQDEAKKYDGQQVKVTGTLEVASNTIHVTKIEAA
jgi:hypothetical protein